MRTLAPKHSRAAAIILGGALLLLVAAFSYASLAAPQSTLSTGTPSTPQESTVTLTGTGFAPGEPVALWQTYPDFTVYGLGEIAADESGAFAYSVFLGQELPVGRHTITARGALSGREEYLDLELTLARGPEPTQPALLSATPFAERQGATVTLSGSGFGAGETVALWGRYPDGGAFDLATVASDGAGNFEVLLAFGGNPVGTYVFSAQGLASGRFTYAEMLLEVNDLTPATGPAALAARPLEGAQQRAVAIEANGFEPGEAVTIWTTMPDASTSELALVSANELGAFYLELLLDETVPVGQHVFSAFGNTSGKLATTPYFLDAGGGPRQP
jgi:hypothetical protein